MKQATLLTVGCDTDILPPRGRDALPRPLIELLSAPSARLTIRRYRDGSFGHKPFKSLDELPAPAKAVNVMPNYYQAVLDKHWRLPEVQVMPFDGDPMSPIPDSATTHEPLQIREFTQYEKQWLLDTEAPFKKLVSRDETLEIMPSDPLSTRETMFALSGSVTEWIGALPRKVKDWWSELSDDDKTGWKLVAAALGVPVAVLLGKGIIAKYGDKLWLGAQISKLAPKDKSSNDSDTISRIRGMFTESELKDIRSDVSGSSLSDVQLLSSAGVAAPQAAILGSTITSPTSDPLVGTDDLPTDDKIPLSVIQAVADIGASIQQRLDGSDAVRSFPTVGAPYELITRRIPGTFVDPELGFVESPDPYLPRLSLEPVLSGGKLLNALGKAKNFLKNTKVGQAVSKVAKTAISALPGGGLINTALSVGANLIPSAKDDQAVAPEPVPAPMAPANNAVALQNMADTVSTPGDLVMAATASPQTDAINVANKSQLPPGWNIVFQGAPPVSASAEQNQLEETAKTLSPDANSNDSVNVLDKFKFMLAKYPKVFPVSVQLGNPGVSPTRDALELLDATSAVAFKDGKKYRLATDFTGAVTNYVVLLKDFISSSPTACMSYLDQHSGPDQVALRNMPIGGFISESTTDGCFQLYCVRYYLGLGLMKWGGLVRNAKAFFQDNFKDLDSLFPGIYRNIEDQFDADPTTEDARASTYAYMGKQLVLGYSAMLNHDPFKASLMRNKLMRILSAGLSDKLVPKVSWSESAHQILVEGSGDKNAAVSRLLEKAQQIGVRVSKAALAGAFADEASEVATSTKRVMPNPDNPEVPDTANTSEDKKGTDPAMVSDSERTSVDGAMNETLDDSKVINEHLATILAASEHVTDKKDAQQWERALAIVGASASVIALLMPVIKRMISKADGTYLEKLAAVSDDAEAPVNDTFIPLIYY